jgi:hypothetical protein
MAEKKKTPIQEKKRVVEEPEPDEKAAVQEARPRWGLGSIIWGLLLITVGMLALLNNFGVISLNLVGLSQLWPLLFVVWGASILSVRSSMWRALMILLVGAILVFAVWVAIGGTDLGGRQIAQRQSETVGQVDSAVKSLDVSVEAGAGKVTINSEDMKDELRAVLNSNVTTLQKTTARSGDTERITLKQESKNQLWIAGVRNELNVTMSRRLPSALSLKLGAADLQADLSELKLDQLKLVLGAASADVRLGANWDNVEVHLNSGASSLTLHIPKSTGVRVEVDGGVSSKDFEGLDKKSDNEYESSNYQTAAHKVTITGDIGATSFTIDRY